MPLLPALILALGLAVAGWQVGTGLRDLRGADRYVTVKGLAEMEVEADLVIWPLTFVQAADELPRLYDQLASNLEQVHAFLKVEGLGAAEVATSPPRLQDSRAEGWGDNSSQRFRYRAEQTLIIRSEDAPGVKRAMQNAGALIRGGLVFASYGPEPEYLFTRLNDIKPSLIAQATAAARASAEQFAQDAQSRVGSIRSANQGVITISDRDAATPERKVVRVVSTLEYRLD